MDSDRDKPSSSVKLDGFAPPAGSGAGSSSSSLTVPVGAPPSAGGAASAPSSSAAAVAGGGAGTGSLVAAAAPPAKKPAAPQAKRTNKKRAPKKNGAAAASASSSENNNDAGGEETVLRPLSDVGPDFSPLSLGQIQLRLRAMLENLPTELPEVPPAYDLTDPAAAHGPIQSFASTLQVAIEEYNLVLSLVSAATYRWGVDRSGASQQNLGVMSAELQQCQDVISNVVSARLSNVLCPAADMVIGEVEIVREGGNNGANGEEEGNKTPAKKRKLNDDNIFTTNDVNTRNERRINHYTRPIVDPSYVHLCHRILARNATLIRHTVATSIHTAQRVIGDYLNAMKKDSSHEDGKGGYY